MRHVDLFSGIGGFSIAAGWCGYETIQFVEREPFRQKHLAHRWPGVPIHDDIRTFDGKPFRGRVDLLTGGFPCQDISIAGKGEGIEGERSRLWFDMLRVIREARPSWVVIENSPRLRVKGADRVLGGLEEAGYSCWPLVVGADDCGGCHERKRVWIVAHADDDGHDRAQGHEAVEGSNESQVGLSVGSDVTDTESNGRRPGRKGRHSASSQGPLEQSLQGSEADPNSGEVGRDRRIGRSGQSPGAGPHGQSLGRDAGSADEAGNALRVRRAGKSRRRAGEIAEDGPAQLETREGSDSDGKGLEIRQGIGCNDGTQQPPALRADWWEFGTPLRRAGDGLPNRVDRIAALGDSIVPQVAYQIIRCIPQGD